MEVMPGYKQTEAGVIPEDWTAATLGSMGKCHRGVSYDPAADLAPFDTPTTVRLLRSNNVQDSTVMFAGMQYVDSRRVSAVQRMRHNDVLICMANGSRDLVGKAGRFAPDEGFEYTFGAFMGCFRPNTSAVDDAFLFYLFQTETYRRQIAVLLAGSSINNLTPRSVEALLVGIPPTKAEQEAIAEALSDAESLIESLEQLLTKKRQLKQGAMQELLTGKMRVPGFSGEWEEKRLGDIFSFTGGFTASRDQLSSEGYCYLHYGDIHTSKKSFVDVRSEFQEIPKLDIPLKRFSSGSLLADGDVVFVDASEDDEGTSKHVVIVNPDGIPFISGLHTIVAKSKTDALDHRYRRYCFQTPVVKAQFRFFAVGTKVSGISKTNIARVDLPVPSVPEQTAIAAILSDMDAEIVALEAKLAKARQLKQGMMHELLTGRIRLV